MTTGKTIVLTRWTFVGKVMSLLFNMLSRLVTTFLPRSKRLLISRLQSPPAVILEPRKTKNIVSALYIHYKVSNLQRCKRAFSCPVRLLVHVPGGHCHVCASSVSACAFMHFSVQCSRVGSTMVFLLKPRVSGRKCKSSSDVAGTAKKHQELKTQRKDEERQKEVTAELKIFMRQEMARGFSLSEQAALVSEAQDSGIEWYMKVVAAVQNAVWCYHIIMMRKKEPLPRHHWIIFFKESRQN